MPDHAERNNQWLKDLRRLDGFSPKDRQPQGRLLYSHLLEVCQQLLPPNTVYCLDSGQIRRAGNMMLKAHDRQTIVQSDTLSPMGMGLCAAIGAKAALPERPVVALVGDGSMRMHGMELSTAHRYHLPIIFVLCDNESLASTPGDDALKQLPCVQWGMFAYAFGVRTFFSTDKRAFAEQLKIAVASSDPVLLWTRVPKLLDEEIEITVNRFDTSWLSKFQK
jgi:acetolactate synthase-1/2/3 large subunit